jgi:hypothetical protein
MLGLVVARGTLQAEQDDTESSSARSDVENTAEPAQGETENGTANQGPAATKPRITVSKETTFLEGPLTEDGYVDYRAALNAMLSEGVTPENNAAVLLWQCSGPKGIAEENREEFFKLLGIDPLPEEGAYFVTLKQLAQNAGVDPEDWDYVTHYSQQRLQAFDAPWKADDLPNIADWLAANEKHLKTAAIASRRTRYCQPTMPGDWPSRIEALGEGRHGISEMARAFRVRAMLRMGEGNVDSAWEDILAVYRLARLLGQGGTINDAMEGDRLDRWACDAGIRLLQFAEVTPDQARKMQADLRELAPLPSMGDKVNHAERFMFLDRVALMARNGPKRMRKEWGDYEDEYDLFRFIADRTSMTQIDWNEVLKLGNVACDRLIEASRIATYPERAAALEKWHTDMQKLQMTLTGPLALYAIIDDRRDDSAKAAGQYVARLLVGYYLSVLWVGSQVEDRQGATFEVTQAAFALAVYKGENGEYPARLDALVPRYVPEVPLDRFTDKPLRYEKSENGYLLYALGLNQRDDGGSTYTDRRGGDDIVVRIEHGE